MSCGTWHSNRFIDIGNKTEEAAASVRVAHGLHGCSAITCRRAASTKLDFIGSVHFQLGFRRPLYASHLHISSPDLPTRSVNGLIPIGRQRWCFAHSTGCADIGVHVGAPWEGRNATIRKAKTLRLAEAYKRGIQARNAAIIGFPLGLSGGSGNPSRVMALAARSGEA